jgi:hypothetical protein
MAPFLNLFEERLAGCGVRRGDRILVAFSGGADSTALLHALARLAPAAGLTLAAAHLNHGFRPEADEENNSVSGNVRHWQFPSMRSRWLSLRAKVRGRWRRVPAVTPSLSGLLTKRRRTGLRSAIMPMMRLKRSF